jgi:hypothetical protein
MMRELEEKESRVTGYVMDNFVGEKNFENVSKLSKVGIVFKI